MLALQPTHTAALEGREDALSELLQQARQAIAAGDLRKASALIVQAREYDAGHVDLPDAQAQLARAVEARRRGADGDLRRMRLEQALAGYRLVLAASAADAAAQQGIERIAVAYAQRSAREASDFDFAAAQASLRLARELSPRATVVREAEQALARARQSQSRLGSTLSTGRKETARAELAGGDGAGRSARRMDRLRPAKAPTTNCAPRRRSRPDDAAVKRAAARVLRPTRACFEDELRGNRVRRARACYDAWQTLETRDAGLADARRRLSLKWIAVGDERLGSGDVEFAAQALQEARALDANAPGLAEFVRGCAARTAIGRAAGTDAVASPA